ncbi:MAG: single-stranded DNA-binding protein [Candidatus Pacebacteria bacterium]|nr:single-stranded DNA-binding protein [Candidatus Paceibacterota bacterium]
MNLNKVFLLGNLASDPETRTTQTGQIVCSFRMATNRVWFDKQSGEKKTKAEFHRIVVWGKLANVAAQYLTKGSLVFIEGRLTTRGWEDKSGNKRSTTEIIAEGLQLGPKGAKQNSSPAQDKEAPVEDDIPIIEEEENIDVSDIPF